MFELATKHPAQETETRSRKRREGGGDVSATETVAPWRRVETAPGECQGGRKVESGEKSWAEG